jgi:hypothetical protein
MQTLKAASRTFSHLLLLWHNAPAASHGQAAASWSGCSISVVHHDVYSTEY